MKKGDIGANDEDFQRQQYSELMKDNSYFKKFTWIHQSKIELRIDKVYGKGST